MKRNRGSKGFTIAEVVVSLAVIAIVSLAATSVILSGIRIQKNTRDKFYAVNLCENAVELFQAAVDGVSTDPAGAEKVFETLQSNMKDLLGLDPKPEAGALSASALLDENWEQTESGAEEAYRCFLALQEEEKKLTFTVEVTAADGSELYAMSYVSLTGGAM